MASRNIGQPWVSWAVAAFEGSLDGDGQACRNRRTHEGVGVGRKRDRGLHACIARHSPDDPFLNRSVIYKCQWKLRAFSERRRLPLCQRMTGGNDRIARELELGQGAETDLHRRVVQQQEVKLHAFLICDDFRLFRDADVEIDAWMALAEGK